MKFLTSNLQKPLAQSYPTTLGGEIKMCATSNESQIVRLIATTSDLARQERAMCVSESLPLARFLARSLSVRLDEQSGRDGLTRAIVISLAASLRPRKVAELLQAIAHGNQCTALPIA
jgi:hypothetical protein